MAAFIARAHEETALSFQQLALAKSESSALRYENQAQRSGFAFG